MSAIVVKCPKCGSSSCFPTFIGDGAMCVPCGHEFDMRPGLWSRLDPLKLALALVVLGAFALWMSLHGDYGWGNRKCVYIGSVMPIGGRC